VRARQGHTPSKTRHRQHCHSQRGKRAGHSAELSGASTGIGHCPKECRGDYLQIYKHMSHLCTNMTYTGHEGHPF
jgi:hypothetical protein